MKTKYLSIFPLLFVSFLFSCQKETRYHLTDVDKQMCPYKIGDTILYTNEDGRLIALTTKGISTDWERWDGNVWFQFQKTYVQSENGIFGITITILGVGYGSDHSRSLMVFNKTPGHQYDLKYDKTGSPIEDTGHRTHDFYVYDSLLIGNHIYYEVAGSVAKDFNSGQITSELYYNKSHGVLQMTTDGKTMFTLQEYIPAR